MYAYPRTSALGAILLTGVVEGFRQSGFAQHLVIVVGLIERASVVVFLPRPMRIPGVLLLTGVLGGAVATNLRIGDPAFVAPAVFALLIWAGVFLRDARVRQMTSASSGQ